MTASTTPLRLLMLNWRDTTNPEGGGSERYVESVARLLAGAGHDVTVFCAAHENAPADEVRDGVRFVRRGSKLGVYPHALWWLARRRSFDVVVDVQNGLPFFSPLVTRAPVVVLVHHVHREQWPVVYGPVRARLGWWIESWLAPRIYRRSQYVAVSDVTRRELVGLGVDADRIAVVHNGTDTPLEPLAPADEHPRLTVLGRLVPHKRVEHALEVLARLRVDTPDLRLTVVGHGWWADQLRTAAAAAGVGGSVDFLGYVDDHDKHLALARSWVLLTPSLKEGWGLCVAEAASHGVPSIAYASAGGVTESIVHGQTGLLVGDDLDELTAATRLLLEDSVLRRRLGDAAREWSAQFAWTTTAEAFLTVLRTAASGGLRHDADVVEVAHVEGEPVGLRQAGGEQPGEPALEAASDQRSP
jgi:glycosyltransferase involved in cell wall biosynthesis